jgi:hypothetical protein
MTASAEAPLAAATVERAQPATPDQVSPLVAALLERAADPVVFQRWQAQVAQTGYCSRPIRLAGQVEAADPATGELRVTYSTEHEPDGMLLVACGNRRAARCPSCSETYRRDAFHLVALGLRGGKGLPETVAAHPRVFATFTAPSFGPVHTRRARGGTVYPCQPARLGDRCAHGRRRACWHRHDQTDPRLGEPICPDCYDHQAQALWNALAPELWRRTTITLRRVLAHRLGLTAEQFARAARVAYVKVAEYQARGAVHFHAVFRLDGRDPADPAAVVPPPEGATVELLAGGIREAADRARVVVPAFGGAPERAARWGPQLDLRVIRPASQQDSGELSARAVAGYIAKYATKATEGLGGAALDRRIHTRHEVEALQVPEHVRRLVAACWELGGNRELRPLRLRQWAHMLGFRGHFATKSRRYSTTFRELRRARIVHAARRRHGEAAWLDEWGRLPEPDAVLVTTWRFVGAGYRTAADAELAASAAAWAREQRQIAREELAAMRAADQRTGANEWNGAEQARWITTSTRTGY